jgi:predicted enzyme related to lactoylglutathione lyase
MEVILYVEDMNSQVSFYRDKLGLQVKFPKKTVNYGKEFCVELDSGPCTLALHTGGEQRFGADAPKIVFRVGDILAARQELTDQEVEMGEIRSAAPGVWVSDGIDPEGNKFSIESHE